MRIRAARARILISSTAHQPLAESRSFAHFISRAETWRAAANLRTVDDACGKLANCTVRSSPPPSFHSLPPPSLAPSPLLAPTSTFP